jgi:flagellar motor protein MotB
MDSPSGAHWRRKKRWWRNTTSPRTRLANDGLGVCRPVESNDTLEGRARNRRVELIRQ